MNSRLKLVFVGGVFMSAAAWTAMPPPVVVSPGSATGVALIGERCPTFLWGGAEGAKSYELVVYRLGEHQETETATAALRVTLPGSAHGWKPALADCLDVGGRYAWSLRSAGKRGTSPWSEPSLFEIAGTRPETSVEEAMRVLRTYVEEAGEVTPGSAQATDVGRGENAARAQPRRVQPPRPQRATAAPGSVDAAKGRRGQLWDDLPELERARARSALVNKTVGPRISEPRVPTPHPRLDRPAAGSPQAASAAPTLGDAALGLDGDIHLDATSSVFKNGHLFLWDDGNYNTGLGSTALSQNTTGVSNTAVGNTALTANGAGSYNTAVGSGALYENTSGYGNTAVGDAALRYNNEGGYNTAVGINALWGNTGGSYNSALGNQALLNNQGSHNSALGNDALKNNQASQNTAVGSGALRSNTTGSSNTALGREALSSNQIAEGNTAVGSGALARLDYAPPDGYRNSNTAMGTGALGAMEKGGHATVIGSSAASAIVDGNFVTAVGSHTLASQEVRSPNTAVGTFALMNSTTGKNNTAVGGLALKGGRDESDNPIMTGSNNVAVGSWALYSNTEGNTNTGVGYLSLYLNTTGYRNTALGRGTMVFNVNGYRNTAVGNAALLNNVDGFRNAAVGDAPMFRHVSGSYNTAMGEVALRGGYTGDCLNPPFPDCTSIGMGNWNTAIGSLTMQDVTTGSENSALGMKALQATTTGSRNLALGKKAGYLIETGSNNILIGHEGGAIDEGYTIRIGSAYVAPDVDPGSGQKRTFVAGIAGVAINNEVPVCIDSVTDQLGACAPPGALSPRTSSAPRGSEVSSALLAELERQAGRVRELEARLEALEGRSPP